LAFCFYRLISIQLKEKRQCDACGPDKKHDRKKQQNGWPHRLIGFGDGLWEGKTGSFGSV
jgi:hypothetical protein